MGTKRLYLRVGCWAWVWLLCLGSTLSGRAGLSVSALKCEYRVEPLGIDTTEPRLSWQLESRQRGEEQSAYEIVAASSASGLKAPDLWDSGKVAANESLNVVYGGKPLQAGQRVYWRVRVWDKSGKASGWSAASWWEMGLLKPEDWKAAWINRPRPEPQTEAEFFTDRTAPLLRKAFGLRGKVRRARVYVSGLGYYELWLNGRRVGDHLLDPGWTSYGQRVLYSTYDVTEQLKRGTNAMGAVLGNGWYEPLPLRMFGAFNFRDFLAIGQPRLLVQLEIEYADGTKQVVGTDTSWKTADGPILRNNVYLGEKYDARRELTGWNEPGFDDANWQPASVASEPVGRLCAQEAPPIRITRKFKPIAVTEPQPGVYVFDFGQNFAGWVRLHVKGPAGTAVKLRYGELLYPDGRLNGMTSVAGQNKRGGPNYRYDGKGMPLTAFQEDEYILKGGGNETYTPRFTFHGFRYVELTGFPGRPDAGTLEGLGLNSDVARAGSFACSNERLNRIQRMVVNTELSNLFSVQSDCPHREKLGYGGDIIASGEMGMFNFDMSQFYAKAAEDLADAVRPNGGFTETAPYVGISSDGLGEGAGPIGWASAQPVLLRQLYQYYGNRRLMEEQYGLTKRWIEFLQTCATNQILDNGISDHESLVPKPRALTGTGFYYWNAKLFSEMAHILGHEDDAVSARELASKIKAAFNEKFFHADTGQYDTGSQACQAFALRLGLVPEEQVQKALNVLVTDVTQTHQGHLTTGIFGTKFMLETLTRLERPDVAYEMVNQSSFPGWGFMLEHGATTLWEHWEFSDNVYSHNHPMFGSVSEWLFKSPGGIAPAEDAVGFSHVVLEPQPEAGLDWVKASYDSVRGRIASEWKKGVSGFEFRAHVPVGVRATVLLPIGDAAGVRESGKALERAPGVVIVGSRKGKVELEIGSGDYRFMCGPN